MREPQSSYYPPRAGWSRSFHNITYAAKRRLHIEKLNVPRLAIDISTPELILCLLLPGFSFYDAGWKRMGITTTIVWFVTACVFLTFLGYTTANVAFGLMMSMHVSSIIYLLNRVTPGAGLVRRLGLSLAVLFVVGQLVYALGLRWFQTHVFMPLQLGDKVYVINCMTPVRSIHRGDLIACHVERTGYRNVWIQQGYLLDRILAGPRDQVEFTADAVRINGLSSPRLPLMLAEGSLVMPENTWLVWPSLRTVTRYNASEYDIGKTVLQMAQVHREQVIGKPFRRWFWRDQTQ